MNSQNTPIPPEEYYVKLPKKRMGSGALIFNTKGEFMVLKTTYKKVLEVPGGAVELNESPLEACRREIKEEIGLDLKLGKLLVVDYQHERGIKTESLMFIFDGGTISDEEIGSIRLQNSEIEGVSFLSFTEAEKAMAEPLKKRLKIALDVREGKIGNVYIENGFSI